MQAELQEAAAAVRATQGETVASEFARLFDQRFSAFEEVQSRLNVKLTERHEAQETRLLAEQAAVTEAVVLNDPRVLELQRQQTSLLSQKRYQEAYEMLARVERAKKSAEREHRLRVELVHAQALGDLKRRQRVERAELSVAYEELEHELLHLRARHLFELGGQAPAAEAPPPFFQPAHAVFPMFDTPWFSAQPLGPMMMRGHPHMETWPHDHGVQWSPPPYLSQGMPAATAAMYAAAHAHTPQAPPHAWWPGPQSLSVGQLPLVPIPAGWSNAGRTLTAGYVPAAPVQLVSMPSVVTEEAALRGQPTRRVDTEDMNAAEQRAVPASVPDAPPPTSLDVTSWHASPPRNSPSSSAPLPEMKSPGVQSVTAPPAPLPEDRVPPRAELSDDSSEGSMSDTSSLGGGFQEERSSNVDKLEQPLPPPPPQQPASDGMAAPWTDAQSAGKNAGPQSSLSTMLAARRATETAALAAAAQRREFTTSDFRQLFSYCRHGKYRQVKDLLSSGCPVDGRDQFGNTPLIVACQNGHARIAKALLRSGANIHAFNRSGNTSLHYACSFGFTTLSDFLISQGANDKARNLSGLSPYEGIK